MPPCHNADCPSDGAVETIYYLNELSAGCGQLDLCADCLRRYMLNSLLVPDATRR